MNTAYYLIVLSWSRLLQGGLPKGIITQTREQTWSNLTLERQKNDGRPSDFRGVILLAREHDVSSKLLDSPDHPDVLVIG